MAIESGGCLPAWKSAELPAPPPFTWKNIVAVIGPGTIALSMSIGGGEWLIGPANVVKYGFSVMWICALGILFQLVINLELIRYTMYTGEPAVNGFMRTRPGPAFWAVLYLVLALCQVGWPAWAYNSASTLFALTNGHLPQRGDGGTVLWIGVGMFLLTIVIVAFGGKIERMLEIVNWFMVLFIVSFLLYVDLRYVPWSTWWAAILGHAGMKPDYSFQFIPPGADWTLLGAFAGFAGNGGIGNIWTTNWIRDKGYGMGSVVGYIPSAVGGKVVKVSPVGSIFPASPENVARWRVWLKYMHVDQVWVWAVGCFLGMFLNVILAAAVIPQGTDMSGLGSGAKQAEFLAKHGGQVLFYMTLLNGFWILFGTQLCIVEGFVRLSTDIVWSSSERVRKATGGDIRRVYYVILGVFALWGCYAIRIFEQFKQMSVAANVAGFILVVAGIHILLLNGRVLPKELRSPAWIRAAVWLGVIFYLFFSTMNAIGEGAHRGWWSKPF
jgi:Mn2+/Fe2+ NRAMP family transporter